MRAADGHVDGDVPVDVVTKRSKAASKFLVLPRTSRYFRFGGEGAKIVSIR